MGRKMKEGDKGSKANFITRNQTLKKLQISLPEFRKLCILKGIYPREPSRFPKGKDKTYYFKKDILYLMHDPLLEKFREHRIWKRKVKTAKDKKEWDVIKRLKSNKPTYNLSHLVKERYPTFIDALQDLDDALSTVYLFSMMPSTKKIAALRVRRCQELVLQWTHFISQSHCLEKTFVSIKGIYYQAAIPPEISGGIGNSQDGSGNVLVTWLVPFTFTQKVTKEVDYKVLMSFLEFYEVLLGFVMFKLYAAIGKKYPPQSNLFITTLTTRNLPEENIPNTTTTPSPTPSTNPNPSPSPSSSATNVESSSIQRIASLQNVLKKASDKDKDKEEEPTRNDQNDDDIDDADAEVFGISESTKNSKLQKIFKNLFSKCFFWLSRETPLESLQFVIRSFGGKVGWEGATVDGQIVTENDERITHHVIDRGTSTTTSNSLPTKIEAREYVQPQYVYDCINAKLLLPTTQYQPGATLPPHLSPFVDDYGAGYVPEYRQTLDSLFTNTYGIKPNTTQTAVNDDDEEDNDGTEKKGNEMDKEEDSSEDEEARYARELQTENKKVVEKGPKVNKHKRQREVEQEEQADQKETAEALLPRKKRRLLQRIKYSQKMKEDKISKLNEKREMLEEGTAEVVNGSTVVYNQ